MKKGQIIYPPYPPTLEPLIALIKKCLIYDPNERPSFAELLKDPYFDKIYINDRTAASSAMYRLFKTLSDNGKIKTVIAKRNRVLYVIKTIKIEEAVTTTLETEVSTLSKLRNCKNVVRLHEFFKRKDTLWLVMDYYSGGDLEHFIQEREKNKQPLSAKQQIFIAHEVLKGIREVHARNLVHRDINPRNVVLELNEDRRIVKKLALCDFDLAKFLLPSDTTKTVIGYYQSPEQALSKEPYSNSTDIWSFGMLLYFIIFGIHIYSSHKFSSTDFHGKAKFHHDDKRISSETQPLFDVMKKCLVLNPPDRPKADELLAESVFNNLS